MTLAVSDGAQQERDVAAVLGTYRTEAGSTLLELADQSPVLLIFLRHFGCSFCRQTLDDVSKVRHLIEAKLVRVVFVHLGSPERARPYFDYYQLSDVERVSNPDASLYRLPAFALPRVSPFFHFLVPRVWRGWLLGAWRKHGIGMIKEDAEQMPGIFYIRQRTIERAYRYRTIADRPDYLKLIA